MSFSYSVPFQSDRDRMRFHIGDTNAAQPKFSDEELDAVLGSVSSWQAGVLMALRTLIMRLAAPDFKADWLEVKSSQALKAYQMMLAAKRTEFGLSAVSGSITRVTRGE